MLFDMVKFIIVSEKLKLCFGSLDKLNINVWRVWNYKFLIWVISFFCYYFRDYKFVKDYKYWILIRKMNN